MDPHPAPFGPEGRPGEDALAARRLQLVRTLADEGIKDPAVLATLANLPRHLFVPPEHQDRAYDNVPLPIGAGQTISQPLIVALMTELAQLQPSSRVLEIGTGCGYQTAMLAALAGEVYTIEIVEPLARRAHELLAALGVGNVRARVGDGYEGWPEAAPFDAIVVTAAPPRVPAPLIDQLAPGGRLVLPVGEQEQQLRVITRLPGGFAQTIGTPVRFVPMTGRAQER